MSVKEMIKYKIFDYDFCKLLFGLILFQPLGGGTHRINKYIIGNF